MPRFVILEHDHPTLHWDLMLEAGEVLWTWRLAEPPGPENLAIAATRIGDHRRLYLDYEGPVSGGRGRVTPWDAGTYDVLESRHDRLHLDLRGSRITARVLLVQQAGDKWRFERFFPPLAMGEKGG